MQKMNKFLFIAIIISAIIECCLSGLDLIDLENVPKAKLISLNVCNADKRPDPAQWANLLNCSYPNRPSPENEKFNIVV
jgi:hypothetical protein